MVVLRALKLPERNNLVHHFFKGLPSFLLHVRSSENGLGALVAEWKVTPMQNMSRSSQRWAMLGTVLARC